MSKNCIQCVKNPRTGFDLLCDECRGGSGNGEAMSNPCYRCGATEAYRCPKCGTYVCADCGDREGESCCPLPLECVRCGVLGPRAPDRDGEHPGWLCAKCYGETCAAYAGMN